MSKTTKALAILGVVAGLGVAALPFNVMAATTHNGVTIHDEEGTDTATDIYGDNDGNVDDEITVRTTIDATLTIAINGDNDASDDAEDADKHLVLLGTDGKLLNGGNGIGKASVVVTTNHVGGYEVNIKGTNGGLKGKTTNELIPNLTAAVATNAFPTTGDSAYGFAVSVPEENDTNGTTFALTAALVDKWQAVPSDNALQIAKNTKATNEDGDTFDISFQAHASASQAADTYEDIVTVTATTNLSD